MTASLRPGTPCSTERSALRAGIGRHTFPQRRAGIRLESRLAAGYALSLLGFFPFGAGGVADMLWHEAFGFEESIEALISPSHLFLP